MKTLDLSRLEISRVPSKPSFGWMKWIGLFILLIIFVFAIKQIGKSFGNKDFSENSDTDNSGNEGNNYLDKRYPYQWYQ